MSETSKYGVIAMLVGFTYGLFAVLIWSLAGWDQGVIFWLVVCVGSFTLGVFIPYVIDKKQRWRNPRGE